MTVRFFLARAASVAALVVAGGCASTALPPDQAAMVTPELEPSLALAKSDSGSVIVTRDAGGTLGTRPCDYRLSLDGRAFADISYGQGVKIHASPGRHVLGLSMPSMLCDSGETGLEVTVERHKMTFVRITIDAATSKATLVPFVPS